MSGFEFGTDFGQKVDLTASIRGILRNYPEGTSILKELVQNADDAGAQVFSICLDERHHATSSVADKALAQFQGPALLAYNSGIFTERDFQSIQRIGDSLKKTADDQNKIGRFGIGFNAVYHLTDLPSFVSNGRLVMLDPQARFLPNVNPSNPGKMVDWIKSPAILEQAEDQFKPYHARGKPIDWKKPFQGTVFRLPLRTTAQGETSSLSKRALTVDEAHSLLESLREEAAAMLLFLKNVETIEISYWGAHDDEPVVRFCSTITNANRELRSQRAFVGDVRRHEEVVKRNKALSADFSLDIACSEVVPGHEGRGVVEYIEKWEVCNQLGGDKANLISGDPANSLLRLVPWGGAAACVSSTYSLADTIEAQSIQSGLAYCFLPLPVRTGLPVMVNGFFELSSNRRDVWQAGSDMTGDGQTRAKWNIALMTDIVAPCYMRLLLRLREGMGFTDAFQRKWPDAAVPAPWSNVVNATMTLCARQRLLEVCSSADAMQALIASSDYSSDTPFTSYPSDSWVNCTDAIVLPGDSAFGLDMDSGMTNLCSFLLLTKSPVVLCRRDLNTTLTKMGVCTMVAIPKLVRRLLRKSRVAELVLSQAELRNLCGFLLKYCLSDYPAGSPDSELDQLPVLPLCDNTVARLRIYTQAQAKAIEDLFAMGFSATRVIGALSATNFDSLRASELLFSSPDAAVVPGSKKTERVDGVIILSDDEEELDVFRGAASMLLDTSKIGAKEKAFLLHARTQESSNVRQFQASFIPDLLLQVLPEKFNALSGDGFYPKEADVASKDFEVAKNTLSRFWHYASTRPEAIKAVGNCSIASIPTKEYKSFYPLTPMSHLLAPDTGTIKLPENILNIVEKLGINVVETSCFGDLRSMASVFWDSVNEPNRAGVLSALDRLIRLSKKSVSILFSVLDGESKDALRVFMGAGGVGTLTTSELSIIKNLPILRLVNPSNKGVTHVSAQSNGGEMSTGKLHTVMNSSKIPSELFACDSHVSHVDDADLALLEALGVKVVKRTRFYLHDMLVGECILNLYKKYPQVTEKAVLDMLTDMSSLCDEDENFHNELRSRKFLAGTGTIEKMADPTNNADNTAIEFSLKRPTEMYDPQESELVELLHERFFPSPAFQGADTLVVLRSLGLLNTLSWNGVVDAANAIGNMKEERSETKHKRARCLLNFLDKNIYNLLRVNEPKKESGGGLFGGFLRGVKSLIVEEAPKERVPIDMHIRDLQQIAWVPAPNERMHACMPWPEQAGLSCTAAPHKTRPAQDAWLCSADFRIVTESVSSPELRSLFGWDSQIPYSSVAKQLREISTRYEEMKTETSDPSDLQDIRETITGLIPQLYQRLNNQMSSARNDDRDSAGIAQVTSILRPCKWIWVGDAFVAADKVALTATISATPYLYQLPQDLKVYSHLLSVFSVKTNFEPRDYVAVLYRMAELTGQLEDQQQNSSEDGTQLPDHEIDLACQLVTLVSTEGSITSIASKGIYFPDNTGKLGLSVSLLYDDVPWMSGPQYVGVRSGCRFSHPNISAHVANKMGVRSLRQALVDKSAESNEMFSGMGEDASDKMEAFGQAESLTSRLKTILDLYPDGNPIFSELIQNADDAGASVVRIMIDETTYERESLLDSRMAPLQGPSLLVYNDAVFTEADFRSLARIGQGSKLEKVSATGRFGLGFNSTYHLTDTPTFVSGEYLVIFDPHCMYAPGATTNQPGLKIRCHGNNMHTSFPDQFRPYRYFGCDFEEPFQGTLFRFPLRSMSMARKSEISSRSYGVAEVEHNLNQLIGGLSHYLLFLRSVKTIEVYRQGTEAGSEPALLYRASARGGALETKNDQKLLRYFDRTNTQKSSGVAPTRDQFYKELASTPDNSLPTYMQRVRVVVESNEPVQEAEHTLSNSKEDVEYLVVSGLRGGGAKTLACDPATRHLKLIPMGGVAACLSRKVTDHSGVALAEELFPKIAGQAFCFLPLPIQTKMPVHCNAYWELSSNRRDIWRGEDTQGEAKLRSDWNVLVMKDVLAPLYANLLVQVSRLILGNSPQKQAGNYNRVLNLLPCPVPPEPWTGLSSPLFKILKDTNLLWSKKGGGMLIAPGSAILIEDSPVLEKIDGGGGDEGDGDNSSSFGELSDEATHRNRMEEVLLMEELYVARVPKEVLDALVKENVSNEVTPPLVRKHFTRTDKDHPVLKLGKDGASSSNMPLVIFLLQYCFSDINKSNYSSLHALPLLPMEDGALGTLALWDQCQVSVQVQDVRDMFVVTDRERALLRMAGGHVVASEAVLGTEVNKILHETSFAEQMNVRRVDADFLLYLLRRFIPGFWFEGDRLVVNRIDVVSDEWLKLLWLHVIEGKHIDLFVESGKGGVMPVLPIMQPASFPAGKFLAKISTKLPVLHMSYKDSASVASRALVDLGIHVFDPSVLGQLSYSAEIGKFVTKPGAKGVLGAINSCGAVVTGEEVGTSGSGRFDKIASQWSAEEALALRDFILDEVLAKLDRSEVAEAELIILRDLPVWPRHGFSTDDKAGFGNIDLEASPEVVLPPRDVNMALVGPGYYRIRSVNDRKLYELLGVKSANRGQFYANYLIPAIEKGDIVAEEADRVVVELMKSLAQLETERAGLTDIVKSSKIVRCNDGQLCAPTDLYDPKVTHLKDLLPRHMFPSNEVFFDTSLLLSLRAVGLRSTISAEGVLIAAKDIEREFLNTDDSADASRRGSLTTIDDASTSTIVDVNGIRAQAVVRRALNLLRYLELNVEELVQENDAEGLKGWREAVEQEGSRSARTSTVDVPARGDIDDEKEKEEEDVGEGGGVWRGVEGQQKPPLGGVWADTLRAITWIPVYTEPPARFADGLPWPRNVHSAALAAPANSAAQENIWFCSSTSRISSYEVKSRLLSEVLGMDRPVPGRNVALQLLNLRDVYEALSESHKNVFRHQHASVCVKLLHSLQDSTKRESEHEVEMWCKVLRDKPMVWIADQFVEPSRLSFKRMVGINAEPFLYSLTSELKETGKLLRLLGVRETFGPVDLASVVRQLHNLHSPSGGRALPLPSAQAEVVLGILRLIVKLVSNDEEEETEAKEGDVVVVEAEVTDADADDDDEVVTRIVSPSTSTPTDTVQGDDNNDDEPTERLPKVTIEELGIIYAPDRGNVLHIASTLSYDDAPWISSALVNKNSQIKFVHQFLSVDEARILGARSLREQLFAGAAVVCPDSKALKNALNGDSIVEALADILSVADSLGASSFDIALDQRYHAAQSLMHPGLADANGPALVVHIGGPSLRSEEVVKLLTPMQKPGKNTSSLHQQSSHDPVNDENNGSGDDAFNVPYPVGGKRLIGTFAVTDCLQILTGTEYFVFDPCGTHLFNESPEESRHGRRPAIARAQRCDLDPAMISRFPDQFLPFLRLPFDVGANVGAGPFPGVLIRMPLRLAASRISDSVVTADNVKEACMGMAYVMEGSLVFSNSLTRCSCGHFEPEPEPEPELESEGAEGDNASVPASNSGRAFSQRSSKPLPHFLLELNSSSYQRNSRRRIMADKGWKKTGGLSIFKNSKYEAPEVSYLVNISKKVYFNGWYLPRATVTEVQSDGTLTHRNWMVASIQGAGRIKDEALKDKYRAHRLPPFSSAAVLLCDMTELDTSEPQPVGVMYCNGCPVGVSGLPFMVEGPFIQDVDSRLVPFYPDASRPRGRIRAQWNETKPEALKSGGFFSSNSGSEMSRLDDAAIENWNESLLITVLEILGPKVLSHCAQNVRDNANKNSGWYKYWPFLSRATPDVRKAMMKSTLFMKLADSSFYLTTRGFGGINDALLPAPGLPDAVVEYMLGRLALTMTPPQLSRDLKELNIAHTALNGVKLREALKREVAAHCNALRSKKEAALVLLDFCLRDLGKLYDMYHTPNAGGGDSSSNGVASPPMQGRDRAVVMRGFGQLCGVPLVPMSDGSVKPFPKTQREKLCFAPFSMHALLPSLSGIFVHPVVQASQRLFTEPLFLECVHIGSFNASVLKDYISLVLPGDWRKSQAVKWVDSASQGQSVGRGIARQQGGNNSSDNGGAASGAPSPELVHVLWKDVLLQEDEESLEELAEWPLLPVVSSGRRLLISPKFLAAVLFIDATTEQDESRAHVGREVDRLASVRKMETRAAEGNSSWASAAQSMEKQGAMTSRWDWIDQTAVPGVSSANTALAGEQTTAASSTVADASATVADGNDTSGVASATLVTSRDSQVLTVDTSGNPVVGRGINSSLVDGAIRIEAGVPVELSASGTRAAGVPVVSGIEVGGAATNVADAQPVDAIEEMRNSVQAALAGFRTQIGAVEVAPVDAPASEARVLAQAAPPRRGALGPPSGQVMAALLQLGVPVADRAIFEEVPAVIKEHLSRQHMTQGRRILDCLVTLGGAEAVHVDSIYNTDSDGGGGGETRLHPVLTSPGGTISDLEMEGNPTSGEEVLLDYSVFTKEQRNALLLEMLAGHQEEAFNNGELTRLKCLSLFTTFPAEEATSIPETVKAYYCTSESVLDTLAILTSPENVAGVTNAADRAAAEAQHETLGAGAAASALKASAYAAAGVAPPIILINDPRLVPLYQQLQVSELTEALAVKQFVVPALKSSTPATRLRIMKKLAQRWDSYKGDNDVVNTLKDVAFVPVWDSSYTAAPAVASVDGNYAATATVSGVVAPGSTVESDPGQLDEQERAFFAAAAMGDPVTKLARKANQVCSWKNRELLEMLRGQQQAAYFNPPWMRETSLHAMMNDLGMKEELSKEMFMEMAKDIERFVGSARSMGTGSEEAEEVLATGALRARRLLRYAKDGDRCMALFDTSVSKTLGKVAFVPLNVPVMVEPGGHIEFRQEVVRFCDSLSASQGALAFSVMPILDEDISPPQMFHSALGVHGSPGLPMVMKHLFNLTENGRGSGLDRWNVTGQTVEGTFGKIFSYLKDNWGSVAAPVRAKLCSANIVPVGHMLTRPSRLFFRLTEDLSPFMHEVPRHFGVHEAFLKGLGVKETPSASDYCEFLEGLRAECRGHPLNANELRAIITVIQNIANENDVDLIAQSNHSLKLCVPDEDSVLQPAAQCLINDDAWLRQRAGGTVNLIHMHILHPAIPARVARQLRINRISQVFVEELGYGPSLQPEGVPEERTMNAKLRKQTTSLSFVKAAAALVSATFSVSGGGENDSGAKATAAGGGGSGGGDDNASTGAGREGQELLVQKLSAMEVRFVKNVPTNLRLVDDFLQLAGAYAKELCMETRENSYFFFSQQDMQVYINVSKLRPPITPELVVSVCVCKLIGLDTSLSATVASLLESGIENDDSHTQRVLDAMQVGTDASTLRERQRGLPGERLTAVDESLLELKPFRIYRQGEVVAISVHAADAGAAPSAAGGDTDVAASDLRYGRVLSVQSVDGGFAASGIRKVQVTAGADKTVTLLSTNIYSFRSARDGGGDRSSGSAPNTPGQTGRGSSFSSATPPFLNKSAAAAGGLPPPPPRTPGSATSGTGADADAITAMAPRAVDDKDVLGAISGLLARTGIPMSLQEKDLMARVLELENTSRRAESELQLERQQHLETRNHLTDMTDAFHCQVCLTNDYDHIMTPCGHPICETCLSSLNSRKCPFCRAGIQKSIKVYLPDPDDDGV